MDGANPRKESDLAVKQEMADGSRVISRSLEQQSLVIVSMTS
jgi:hypothetical protein